MRVVIGDRDEEGVGRRIHVPGREIGFDDRDDRDMGAGGVCTQLVALGTIANARRPNDMF